MSGYYTEKLSAQRLKACYELAPPPVQAYLEAEIAFVLERLSPAMRVLELGCGYGRVLQRLLTKAGAVFGIDTAPESLRLAHEQLGGTPILHLAAMDAVRMGFSDRAFDLTICIQNGISAFAVDKRALLAEAVRVTRRGGTVLFSSYAERFWPHRLAWFEIQAAHGLIGPIDYQATGDGVIVCRDGFRATTADAALFQSLAAQLGLIPCLVEVAGSSLFCEIVIP